MTAPAPARPVNDQLPDNVDMTRCSASDVPHCQTCQSCRACHTAVCLLPVPTARVWRQITYHHRAHASWPRLKSVHQLCAASLPRQPPSPAGAGPLTAHVLNSATVALFKFAASQAPKRMRAKLQRRPGVAGMPVPQPMGRSQPAAQVRLCSRLPCSRRRTMLKSATVALFKGQALCLS